MLSWAVIFLLVAMVAGALGFGGVSVVAAGFAQVLFVLFLIAFVVSLFAGMFRRS